jgi:hypothetical protein
VDGKATGCDNFSKFANSVVEDDDPRLNAEFLIGENYGSDRERYKLRPHMVASRNIGAYEEILTDYGPSRFDIIGTGGKGGL